MFKIMGITLIRPTLTLSRLMIAMALATATVSLIVLKLPGAAAQLREEKGKKTTIVSKSSPLDPEDSVIRERYPMTGLAVPSMESFDNRFCKFLSKWDVPGASIAIMEKGKLVYSRGYGYANLVKKTQVQPDSPFRLCSVSKLFTAAAILKLIEEGKLSLDTKVFPILNLPIEREPFRQPDPRIKDITVRHLLECSAGWDRKTSEDPMFMPLAQNAANEFSNTLRPTTIAIIRYELTKPLDFAPGTWFSYSNFEYAVLGELIHKITGMKYSDYVKQKFFVPMGLSKIYPGKTREPAPGEVSYYGGKGEMLGPSIFPNIKGLIPLEYGGDFYLEAMTADCGWVGSTVDVAKFVSRMFGDEGSEKSPISAESRKLMLERPSLPNWANSDSYHGLAWEIEYAYSKTDCMAKKLGCLPGAEALVGHYQDGVTFVITCSTRPPGYGEFQSELFKLMGKTWKEHKF